MNRIKNKSLRYKNISNAGISFGLVIFYLLTLFSPNKIICFFAYFVSVFVFYVKLKNIRTALVYSLVLSLFFDITLASSWFMMEPTRLLNGSAYGISPSTILIAALLPLSIGQKHLKIKLPDLLCLLFYTWNCILFIVFPSNTVLYSLFTLTEIIISYFLFRLYLTKDSVQDIVTIFMSVMVFQTILGGFQAVLGRPIGLISESVSSGNPYGYTAAEDTDLFRITGSFGHPNFLAAFLLIAIPYLLLNPSASLVINFLRIGSFALLFFTYSRVAWFIGVGYLLLYLYQNYSGKFIKRIKSIKKSLVFLCGLLVVLILVFPFLITRIQTFSVAFDEFGSMGVRFKLYEEALNLVVQYPVSGVGFNRSLEVYSSNPATNLFTKITPSSFYRIHNTFLEMATEIGIPGFTVFILFLVSLFYHYRNNKNWISRASLIGLIGFIGISLLNPFFHTTQFRMFFLLVPIILI